MSEKLILLIAVIGGFIAGNLFSQDQKRYEFFAMSGSDLALVRYDTTNGKTWFCGQFSKPAGGNHIGCRAIAEYRTDGTYREGVVPQ